MTDSVIIDIDKVYEALEERRRINSIDLNRAVFVKDGLIVDASVAEIETFIFTGLNNIDFIRSRDWGGDEENRE